MRTFGASGCGRTGSGHGLQEFQGKIAKSYAPFADAISVLTDKKYFGGDLTYLTLVRDAAPGVPILCKDFVVYPYQIYEEVIASGTPSGLLDQLVAAC